MAALLWLLDGLLAVGVERGTATAGVNWLLGPTLRGLGGTFVGGLCGSGIGAKAPPPRRWARITTPRDHVAVFGAMWNRWCTIKRYQGQGRCRLCQKRHTEDAIEHYAFCSVVRELAARRLRLCTTTHVNIHTFTFTNPLLRTKELLTRAALLIYATYRALNHQREASTPLHPESLYNAMCQWVIEGSRGHAATCRVVASTWTNHHGDPLTPLE